MAFSSQTAFSHWVLITTCSHAEQLWFLIGSPKKTTYVFLSKTRIYINHFYDFYQPLKAKL
jgi:hypothetical protein